VGDFSARRDSQATVHGDSLRSLHASIGNSASLLMATRFHLTLLTVIGMCVPHCPRSAAFLLSLLVIYVTSFDSPDIPVHLIPGSSVNDTDGLLCRANLSQGDYRPCSSVSYFFGEIFGQLFRISRVNFQNHGLVRLSGYLKSWRSSFSSVPVAISARDVTRDVKRDRIIFVCYVHPHASPQTFA